MYEWQTTTIDGIYFVALVDDANEVKRTHPIGFTDIREAHRAADRLNKRDFG